MRKPDANIVGTSTTLAPGASENCTATYVTTQADVNAGSATNVGTVTGSNPADPGESGTAKASSTDVISYSKVTPAAPASAITPTSVDVTG